MTMANESSVASSSIPRTPPTTPPRHGEMAAEGDAFAAAFSSPVVPPTPHEAPLTPLSDVEDPTDAPQPNQQVINPLPDANEEPAVADQDVARVRGTNVHVPTVATTFADFLRTFQSLEISQRRNLTPKVSDYDSDSDSTDSRYADAPPLYLARLQHILQHKDQAPTASLDIDTQHLYYHNPACQKLYKQVVAYPMELVPLMDILVQRELE